MRAGAGGGAIAQSQHVRVETGMEMIDGLQTLQSKTDQA